MGSELHVILYIEDNLADQEIFRRALRATSPETKLVVADDGEQALHYLRREDIYNETSDGAPSLVLLDLNLPGMSGVEVLSEIQQSDLRHLPVIVYSSSRDPSDVRTCYQLGCRAFVAKPLRFDRILNTVEMISKFWLETASLPDAVGEPRLLPIKEPHL